MRAGILFIPLCMTAVLGLVHMSHQLMKTSYLPVVVWMMIFMGLIEKILPFRKAVIKKKNVITDLLFIIINPVGLPLLWYFSFRELFFLEINPYSFFDSMPFLLQVVLVYVGTEFFRYWAHRAQHEVPALWKFHAVHHCMPQLYYLNQFVSHPLDYFLRNVVTLTPIVIFKFDPLAVAYSQGLSTLFGMLSHTNTTIKNGFWNNIFPTYEVHRWHHSAKPSEANANYGIGVLLWDHIFNTFKTPPSECPEKIGIDDESYNIDDWKGLMIRPFAKSPKISKSPVVTAPH